MAEKTDSELIAYAVKQLNSQIALANWLEGHATQIMVSNWMTGKTTIPDWVPMQIKERYHELLLIQLDRETRGQSVLLRKEVLPILREMGRAISHLQRKRGS